MPEKTTVRKVFKVPMRVYNISTGRYEIFTRYFDEQPLSDDRWKEQMLKAQKDGRHIATSYEWSGAQRYLRERHPKQELRLVDTPAWTGTVLDFDDETLKEGITINPDGTIIADTVLGKKQGILLPSSNAYIKELDDKYMPLIRRLHGLKDPKRELPDYAYLWVTSNSQRPVVRGHWIVDHRDDWRVDVGADYGPADGGFAAWFVDEKRPRKPISEKEYEKLQKKAEKIQSELSGSTIIL